MIRTIADCAVGVLNDEFVAGQVLGLAHLPRSHFLQCMSAWSTIAAFSVGAIFEKKTNISQCSDAFKVWLDQY